MGEDGDFVFEGEGVFGGEFGALDTFDGVGCCGGAGVCAPFYYGEGSCAELIFVVMLLGGVLYEGERESWNEQRRDVKDDLQKIMQKLLSIIHCFDFAVPIKFISSSLYK